MLHEVLPFPQKWWKLPNEIVAFRRRRYDMAIDLQGLLRSGLFSLMTGAPVRAGFANGREGSPWCYTDRITVPSDRAHAVERYLYLLQELGVPMRGPITFPLPRWEEAEGWTERLWTEEGIRAEETVCVIHPTAGRAVKRWPAERFAELADWLALQRGYRVVLIAGQAHLPEIFQLRRLTRCRPIDLAGGTSLPQLVALLRKASVLITNDSGPMHLSAAVGTPVVAIFGPTDPGKTGPYGSGHVVLKKDVDCSSCSRDCCTKGSACLTAIGVDEVCHAVEAQMEARKQSSST